MAKNKQPMYGYTINSSGDPTLDDQSGEKFDEKGLRYNRAQLVTATQPDRKAMRYLGMEDESKMNLGEDFDINKAGAGRAGRGKPGGPTAKELADYERKQNRGIFTEDKKMPPSPREMAKGGKVSSASSRADGICIKGKTRGKMC